MNTMNSVIFMPRVMPHIGSGGGTATDLLDMLLTFAIVGVILYLLGILVNILRVKFSREDDHTRIYWNDIKLDLDNSFFGCVCGVLGFTLIAAAVVIGLVAGVFSFIVTL